MIKNIRIITALLFFSLFYLTQPAADTGITASTEKLFTYQTVRNNEKSEKERDHTDILQDALSSGSSMIIIPDKGTPWITKPLFLNSNQIVFIQPGTVIEAKKGEFLERGDKLFEAEKKSNIDIYGYGAVLRMNKNDYREEPYRIGQWRHGISLRSCSNIRIMGLTIENTGGDGVYIGVSGNEQTYCENILLKDLNLKNNYRQGISVISAKNLVIDSCVMSKTQGHPPMAGIDFEPNYPHEILQNITLKNCIIYDNIGAGILFYLASLNNESEPVSINIISNKVSGSFYGLRIAKTNNGVLGTIVLKNNRISLFKKIDPSENLEVIFK